MFQSLIILITSWTAARTYIFFDYTIKIPACKFQMLVIRNAFFSFSNFLKEYFRISLFDRACSILECLIRIQPDF